MRIYNIEETTLGNYNKINYELARQFLIIWETLTMRFLDATPEDLKDTIIERSYVFDFDKPPKYSYIDLPSGPGYYLSFTDRPTNVQEFINWFYRHKQQPADYLIYGTLISKGEMRAGEDKTTRSREYDDGLPIEIEDKRGNTIKRTFKRF